MTSGDLSQETASVVVGIDVGTSGVRVIASDAGGTVCAVGESQLGCDRRIGDTIHEQNPDDWWLSLCQATKTMIRALHSKGASIGIAGIAVTSTSGSLVVADISGRPLRPAILYDDRRGAEIAEALNCQVDPVMVRFDSSYSLVKAVLIQQQEPHVWEKARYLLHPADWLAGKLAGTFGTSDYCNALKLGYDPESRGWGEAVSLARLPVERLPEVFCPGQQIGVVSVRSSVETGLPPGTRIVAGATDGMASLIASGARELGHANTTLGTTLVWKVLAKRKLHPTRGVYCHLHPCGWWAPGAASNTGPGSLGFENALAGPQEMDRLASASLPTPVVCYIVRGRGERFPFAHEQAEMFVEGQARTAAEWYAAQMQSISFVERWGYEVLAQCGVEIGDVIFSTGGAAASSVLSQLRSHVLDRPVARCLHHSAAFGAAILAAIGTFYSGDVLAGMQSMTRVCEIYSPSAQIARRYDEIYRRFREACFRRGYA
jgi:D-ribulokinase